MRKPGLGKGLDAILGGSVGAAGETAEPGARPASVPARPTKSTAAAEDAGKAGEPLLLDIERIRPGSGQPRRHFDENSLEELACSIREQGVVQPLVVTEVDGGYALVAGERRLRAASRAGLARVPVIVKRDVRPEELLELALVENLQREDLRPLEQARGYRRLLDEHGYKQEDIARRIGKSRTAVANTLRLLTLPREVCELIETGSLSEGHARALLGLRAAGQQIQLAGRIVRKALSVRAAEELVRAAQDGGKASPTKKGAGGQVATAVRAVEQNLTRTLGTKVHIRGTSARGRIEIEYYSQDQLNGLVERLGL